MSVDAGGVAVPDEVKTRFRTAEALHAGVSSVVFAGTDPDTGQRVGVKVFRPGVLSSGVERQRIVRDIAKLSQMNTPTLPRSVAAGESGETVWVVRELVQGESLAKRLAEHGTLTAAKTARLAAQLAAGLGELHRHGVLHRDLRPDHIVIDLSGRAVLIDAACPRSQRTSDGRVLSGTAGYAAPEGIAGKLVSFRSDLYSLGAVLFEALEGAPPYGPPDSPGVLVRQCEQDAPAVRASAPEELVRLVGSLLAREPRERPFSAQQLERQMEPLADDPAEKTVISPPPTSAPAAIPAPSSAAPVRLPLPAPARVSGRKATMVGVAPPVPARAPAATATAAARSLDSPTPTPGTRLQAVPETSGFTDPDTVVNDDSREFGIPAAGPGARHGSAVAPLPPPIAAQVLAGKPVAPSSSPIAAPGRIRASTMTFGPGASAPAAAPPAVPVFAPVPAAAPAPLPIAGPPSLPPAAAKPASSPPVPLYPGPPPARFPAPILLGAGLGIAITAGAIGYLLAPRAPVSHGAHASAPINVSPAADPGVSSPGGATTGVPTAAPSPPSNDDSEDSDDSHRRRHRRAVHEDRAPESPAPPSPTAPAVSARTLLLAPAARPVPHPAPAPVIATRSVPHPAPAPVIATRPGARPGPIPVAPTRPGTPVRSIRPAPTPAPVARTIRPGGAGRPGSIRR